ncbi:MAG TPA: 30S ribosomal protein S12 methylthiotransferase RimO [Kofleriaceae bacterium]|nr:30S ribosomal protein S12 methylthiotransferase RimO [Kofleriaceae bacterium]
MYFVSLGCPKNRVDSEVMLGAVDRAGYRRVESPEEAEVIVVNTCGFIDAAKEESIDTILEMAQLKQEGRCRKLVVTGCLTQRYPDQIARDIPEIDHILGSGDFGAIAEVIARGGKGGKRKLPLVAVDDTPKWLYDDETPRIRVGGRHSTYVKIAEGCDRPCAFCIIPKLRGPQRSRAIDSVVREVERLVGEGVAEVNLIAQDLTRYGADLADKPSLAQLLRRVARVPGLRWLRLHYTYPSAFTDELIDVIASEPAIVKYIDVPLQHIDDELLKRMRRGHSSRVTHELIRRLRERIDGLVLRTTFIVGHPGETDDAFARLRDFVAETGFDRMGAFTYSREPGTVSAMLPGRVPDELARERQEQLMELQRQVSRARHQAMIGRQLEVLVDGPSEDSELVMAGRWYGQAPEIDGTVFLGDGEAQPGQFVRAVVDQATDYDLAASIV